MDFSTRVHEFPTTYQNSWPYQKDRPEASLEPLQERGLAVRPILNSGSSVFGAEVSGIDWSKAVSEDIVQQVGDITILV
jgi:alpha-ketoglutarate-dependent 2,4-dichlorophenoxyacetate dioxygenase